MIARITRRGRLFALLAALAVLVVPATSASPRAAGEPQFAACGDGFPQKPPKRYRFHVSGTVTSPAHWGDGKETYSYVGEMKRKVCRGTNVEYWQTKGRVTQAFENIPGPERYPPECGWGEEPPYYGIGNAPATSRPLRRYEVDVGFEWSGDSYVTSVINPRRDDDFVHGTLRCPSPPAANGATVPMTFRHVSTDVYIIEGEPKRVVRGRIVNDLDFDLYRHSFRWKLKAIK